MKINVLGTKYTLRRVNNGQDKLMSNMNFGGYCDDGKKEIVILNMKSVPNLEYESEEIIKNKECKTIKHELIHAFLNESGLEWNSPGAWAKNEEMVDRFAIQMPKLLKAFKEAGCIES